ncbi:MAG: CoA transferase [Chloroflexi bacterium]|nr:CoA transferase [Chloroflexota bacterium]
MVHKLPLEGVKVVDFGVVITGPLVGRALAEYGAQVVKVESIHGREFARVSSPYLGGIPGIDRSLLFNAVNTNKLSIQLNLRHAASRSVIERLVAWADVMVVNLRPGALKRLRLDYPHIHKVRPDIIMLAMSQAGQTGPHADHPGYGGQTMGLAGFVHATGWPDREPSGPGTAYTDYVAPWYALVAVLAALDKRRRTGAGGYFDLSVLEASLMNLAPALLECVANGRVPTRQGNASPVAAPHGAYRCQGEDRWCVIAVSTEEEWERFRLALGNPPWAQRPEFANLESRLAHQDALNAHIEKWTAEHTADEVMVRLQAAGVPAGVVRTTAEVTADAQLAHRGHFYEVANSGVGPYYAQRMPFRLSRVGELPRQAAPRLGEHTEYVCRSLLGMSDEEFVTLLRSGAFE